MENTLKKVVYRHVPNFTAFFLSSYFEPLLCFEKLYLPSSANNVDKSKLHQRSNDEPCASNEPHFTGHNVRHGGHCTAGLAREGDEGQNGADAWKQGTDLY
jgi:hypothetical protein